jgi:hypothetical protein
MLRVIPVAALAAAIGAVGCGATTNTGTTAGSPVYVPPRTSDTSTVASSTEPVQVDAAARGVIPAGQEFDVRLQTPLSSETAKVEQRFESTTVADLRDGNRVLVPVGSVMRGVVSAVDPAGRGLDRKGSLTLSFDQLTVRGRTYDIRGMATQVFESRGVRDEAGTAGVGAGVGGVIGGVIGGLKGAVLGALIGAGGAIVATEGKDIELPAGTIVRVRLDSPVNLR